MTFSIVARAGDGFGVAVASRFLAVGAAVPAADVDGGALATQAYANLAYRTQGLALLRTGVPAADAVAGLTEDDRTAPVAELARLLDRQELYFGRPDPASLLDLTGELADEVGERLARLGYRGALADALTSWAGVENLEERLVPGRIDPLVLGVLRET